MGAGRGWFAVVLAAMATAAGLAGGCAPARPAGAEVRVAAVFPLEGELAAWGEAALAGVRMALVEEAARLRRARLAVTLVPVAEAGAARAVARAHLLAADPRIVAVLGHLDSATAVPASEIYRQGGLLLLSPGATAPEFTRRGLDNVFQLLPDDAAQGEALAEFAVAHLRAGTALVMHDRTVHGQGLADAFADAFQAKGGRLTGYLAARRGEGPAEDLVAEVERRRPSLIFFGGLFPDGCRAVSALAGVAPEVPFLGGDGLDTSAFRLCAVLNGRGAYAGTFLPREGRTLDMFRRRFGAAFGYTPEPVSVYAYDAARCLLGALADAARLSDGRPPRAAVRELLRRRSCRGIALPVSFAPDGRNLPAVGGRASVRALAPRPRAFTPARAEGDRSAVNVSHAGS